MNIAPFRFGGVDSLLPVLIVGAVLALCLGVVLFARRLERRGDWGPSPTHATVGQGYSPADLRGGRTTTLVADPVERWVLGLAAPYVESAGLLHDRWSMVPAFCDAAWRRRLAEVVASWGVGRSVDWNAAVEQAENALVPLRSAGRVPDADAACAVTLARLGMLLRLGVARRYTTGAKARSRLRTAASPFRDRFGDWRRFGDAFLSGVAAFTPATITDIRADVRMLYATGGPWHDGAWPR